MARSHVIHELISLLKAGKAEPKYPYSKLRREGSAQQTSLYRRTVRRLKPKDKLCQVVPTISADGRNNVPFHLADIAPRAMAEEITMIDSEMLSAIGYEEVTGGALMSIDKVKSPHVVQMIDFYNSIAAITATEVLVKERSRDRAYVISRVIQMADECVDFNNFNSAKALMSGLRYVAITRLTKTWKKVPEKHKRTLRHLSIITTSADDIAIFYRHRRACQNPSSSSVHFLGDILGQMTYIRRCFDTQPLMESNNRGKKRQTEKQIECPTPDINSAEIDVSEDDKEDRETGGIEVGAMVENKRSFSGNELTDKTPIQTSSLTDPDGKALDYTQEKTPSVSEADPFSDPELDETKALLESCLTIPLKEADCSRGDSVLYATDSNKLKVELCDLFESYQTAAKGYNLRRHPSIRAFLLNAVYNSPEENLLISYTRESPRTDIERQEKALLDEKFAI
ncbi:uncharacterized protein LOC5514438 [Nematostella vectensis]|uniref:uncharacterized protein LOC5514438 n=1 Tax=Nematostella vectensis TaxID=45351 RepID=UPI0020771EF4|nr:uncharacterized protein LOC5514438 [Nematostella vectensis]